MNGGQATKTVTYPQIFYFFYLSNSKKPKTMTSTIRTAALNFAQLIKKYDRQLSWSKCMLLGWAKAKVMAAIQNGATITYTTDSGNQVARQAVSLTNYTPANGNGAARKTSPLACVYFDKDADGIRSFRIDRLVSVAA
jgi:hypothetical protein